MAYAEVLYLRQLVEEEFFSVLWKTLEFEETKVRNFGAKAKEVIRKFMVSAPTSTPSFLQDIKDYIHLKADVNYIYTYDASMFIHSGQNNSHIRYRLADVLNEFGELDLIFSDFLRCQELVRSLNGRSSEEFTNSLTSLIREFENIISLLFDIAEEALSMGYVFGTLLEKVASCADGGKLDQIKVIEGFGDKIEDILKIYAFRMLKMDMESLVQVKNITGGLGQAVNELESNILSSIQKCPLNQRSRLGQWERVLMALKALKANASLSSSERTLGEDMIKGLDDDKDIAEIVHVLTRPHLLYARLLFDRPLMDLKANTGSSSSALTLGEDIVKGLDDDKDIAKIVDELTRPPPELLLVTITGMGGIGKTTLAQKIYHQKNVTYHFHFTVWVSGNCSIDQALYHILHSISKQRSEEENDEILGHSSEEKGQILWRLLRMRRYLIVIDDVWHFDTWNVMVREKYFPDDKVGSRILITSRSQTFPTHIPKTPPHCMELLNDVQSWEMLHKLVFGEVNCPSELVVTGKRIARKCGGLRLTIAVIAGILLCIPQVEHSWWCIMKDVESIVYDDPGPCLDILDISYYYLPHHLRACFLFMGSFPTNCEIDVQKLFNLWRAEGFLDCWAPNSSEIVSLEELISRSLVSVGQRGIDGRIKTCFIHELLRQLCLKKASKQNFMQVFPEAARTPGIIEKQRHLIFTSMNDSDLLSLPSIPHLRTFMLLTPGSDISQDVLLQKLSHSIWLRVLDMYYLPWSCFPMQLSDLVNLRFLAINLCHVVDDSISRFHKLQTLVVYGPWIPGVGPQLEYSPTIFLHCGRMPCLMNVIVRVPCHLSLLDDDPAPSNLQSLSTLTFSSCKERFVGSMTKLKKLGLHETRRDCEDGNYEECFQYLHSLPELVELKCCFYKRNEKLTRSLGLDALPDSLKRLTLSGSCLSWDQMELLASSPNLETLKLKDYAFRGKVWQLTEVVFRRLKQLLIEKTDLESWTVEGSDPFPRLERLVLRSCTSLHDVPFEEFGALALVDVHNCNEEVEKSAKEFHDQYGNLRVIKTDKRVVMEKGGQAIEYEH